jgi:dipeptidyl aminopeptidase/acylaminoacyl peptidase
MKYLLFIILILLFLIGFFIWHKNGTVSKPIIPSASKNALDQTGSNAFIEQLRQREFTGGKVKIEETLGRNSAYTNYLISYPSDDLTIYGVMNIPQGNGPFPVILLNHGYYNPSSFTSGDGTETMADILARNGYLTLASDYRGHGKSESDGQRGGHRPEYSIDVLNLVASVPSIQKADANNIGMWGHSMGGETSLRAVAANNSIKALVLWAPTLGGGHMTDPAQSPLLSDIKNIQTTISLHQGLVDTEVDPKTSVVLADKLKKEGKKYEYFEYPGQDHNFRNLGWDIISGRTLTFYYNNLQ